MAESDLGKAIIAAEHEAIWHDKYESIIAAKDKQIAALAEAISRRCVDDQACIYADELQAAIKEATNAG